MDCLKLAVIVLLEPCRVTVVVELPGFSIVTSPSITVQPVNSYPLYGVAVMVIGFST